MKDFLHICPPGVCIMGMAMACSRKEVSTTGRPSLPPQSPLDSQDSSEAETSILFLAVSLGAGPLTSLIKNINKAQCLYFIIYSVKEVTS